LNQDGRIVVTNGRSAQILGCAAAELEGQSYLPSGWQVCHVDGRPFAEEELFFNVVKDEEKTVWNQHQVVTNPQGTPVVVAVSASPLWQNDGTFDGVVAVLSDITEAEALRQQHREVEARLANVLQASPMGVHLYHLNEEDELIFAGANVSADRLLGVDNSAFVGRRMTEIFPPLAETEVPARYRAAAAEGQTWNTRQIDYEDDKIRGAFEVYAFQTAPRHMAAFFWDITERLQMEQERQQLEERLQRSQKMESIGRLAGGIAHDFNNLLTVILGLTELASRRVRPYDPLGRDLRDIGKAAERAAALTSQLLAFSRRQAIVPRLVDLNALLDETGTMVRRLIGEDITLIFEASSSPTIVRVDRNQIEQAIVNLAINARDAMPRGGQLSLSTRAVNLDEHYTSQHVDAKPGQYAMIAVSDNGCGMDHETVKQAFEPFFTTKEQGKGTGLGLSMVYGVAQQNRGFVEIYSEEGIGTTVKMYLPLQTETAQAELPRPSVPPEMLGKETILLVEDEEVVRQLSERMLNEWGYDVLTAANGGEALLKVEKATKPIDLLLTDVIMPHMDGKELYQRLRRVQPDLKVLFMSGYTADIIAEHGIWDQDTPFLQKPFSIKSLAKAVRGALDRAGNTTEA
jgi:PAS domain S-box-containing protein